MAKANIGILGPDLTDFLSVADLGSINAAARKMGRDPGNLSRCIHRIESQVGAKLFARHQTGLQLTAEGEQFRAALLASQQEFHQKMLSSGARPIKIGFSSA